MKELFLYIEATLLHFYRPKRCIEFIGLSDIEITYQYAYAHPHTHTQI